MNRKNSCPTDFSNPQNSMHGLFHPSPCTHCIPNHAGPDDDDDMTTTTMTAMHMSNTATRLTDFISGTNQ